MSVPGATSETRRLTVGEARVAYRHGGAGETILLLHGCPFSSFIWRHVMPALAGDFRCLAPDLLGLGDTETPPGADWSLPAQAEMIVAFLDRLGIDRAHVVGHDHGGALAQLLAAEHPDRLDRLVLANAEAYDNWPSRDERPFVRITQVPLLGEAVMWAWARQPLFRLALRAAHAVHDRRALTDELLNGYIAANLADRRRRAKTKRFLAGQLDPDHNRVTLDLLDGLRRFDHPTLLIWATEDPHFGPQWGERLLSDIPGATRLERLRTGHLLMEEQPDTVAALIRHFLLADA
jgi:pimeloyl-ACP methyl ester carboxylesterase